MHGLDADLDLRFLIGRVLQQVCIGKYQIQFRFDAQVSLSIESEFAIEDFRGREVFTTVPGSAAAVCNLLGASITSETHDPSGQLNLHFSDGGTLELTDPTDEYESYQISYGPTLIVV